MTRGRVAMLAAFTLIVAVSASAKTHVITLGKWLPVRMFVGPSEESTIPLQVRPIYVDTKIKEFTTGEPHDVTDRLFVIRRAYRLNDLLPDDGKTQPRWRWQRGGWLLV